MFEKIKESIRRKIARRITKEYALVHNTFAIKNIGTIEFANWQNPLVTPTVITESTIGFFKQFMKQGDVVIDIGAHIGDTTVPMAICAGKQGIAIGIDPNPFVYNILEHNAKLNTTITNIHAYNFAIADVEQDYYFVSSEASFCNGGISTTPKSKHGKYVFDKQIQGKNLIQFLEKNYADALHRISFIKIDTEGYDKEIIKAIAPLLVKYRPILIAECFSKHNKEQKMELYEVFESLNYKMYYCKDFDLQYQLMPLHTKQDVLQWKETFNILGIPKQNGYLV
jgi:FkbM family methyltransferase